LRGIPSSSTLDLFETMMMTAARRWCAYLSAL
jgi:hypothetical protein